MMRFVVLALFVVALWLLLLVLYRGATRAAVDWRGTASSAGWVARAAYRPHATGMGF